MKNFEDFIKEALEGNGVQNDSTDVWVEVGGEQYTVRVSDVLDHEEKEPFEASLTLEADMGHPAWETLYDQYIAAYNGDAE